MAEKDVKLPYKIATFNDWQPQLSFYHPLYAGSIDGTDVCPHDRAVVRAMLSTYKPNKNVSGDQSKTLFVARLSKDTTQDIIQDIFEKFGELEKCRLIRDFVTGFSRGYAFVEFKRKKDAICAARETHKMNIDGRQILVDFECERILDGWKPRRFGGGFGGRKESGQLRFGGIDRPFRRPIPAQVNHFARGSEREDGMNKSTQNSRGYGGGRGEQDRINRDRERHSTREKDREVHDKDHRGYDRDRGDRGHQEEFKDRRGDSRDHDDRKDRDYRSRRDYRDRDRDRDHRRHDDRRNQDSRHRTQRDRYDRDDRSRDRRHRDKGDRRDADGGRSESSSSSREVK